MLHLVRACACLAALRLVALGTLDTALQVQLAFAGDHQRIEEGILDLEDAWPYHRVPCRHQAGEHCTGLAFVAAAEELFVEKRRRHAVAEKLLHRHLWVQELVKFHHQMLLMREPQRADRHVVAGWIAFEAFVGPCLGIVVGNAFLGIEGSSWASFLKVFRKQENENVSLYHTN